MKENVWYKFCVGMVILLTTTCIAACGGEYETAFHGGAQGVSGTAVNATGQVVSGAAVKSPETKKNGEKWFCSDTHVYFVDSSDDNQTLVERSLEDGSERWTEISGLMGVCYADNNWVYFLTEDTSDEIETSYLWRAPVEKSQVAVSKKELLLTEEEINFGNRIYCDGHYVLYTTFKDVKYKKYDLKQKKFIGDFYKSEKYDGSEVLAVAGNTAFIILGEEGLVGQRLDSEEIIRIPGNPAVNYERNLAVTDTDMFFTENGGLGIWQYQIDEGTKRKIATSSQMKKVLTQEGILDLSRGTDHSCYEDRMFVYDNRLYIQIDVSWKQREVTYRRKGILSLDIQGGGDLRCEKKLTGILAMPEKNTKVAEKQYARAWLEETCFLSRGTCLGFSEGKCFMNLYDPEKDKNTAACYDMASGSFRYITKQDPEWYLWYCDDHMWSLDVLEGIYPDDIPNNDDCSGLLEEGGMIWRWEVE